MTPPEDATTPTDLRLIRNYQTEQIISALKDSRMVLDQIRTVQSEQGGTIDTMREATVTTSLSLAKLSTLAEAQDAREQRKEAREERVDAAEKERAAAREGRFLTFLQSDNTKWILLLILTAVAPGLVPKLLSLITP